MSSAKAALVTGSARRIGAVIVRALHADGYSVAIHCRTSRDEADRLSSELNAQRENSACVVQADLREIETHAAIIESVVAAFGRLDLLVNNASTFYPTPLGKVMIDDWDDLLGSNLKAPLFLSQAALPELRRNQGCIVNMIDVHAERPIADHPVYLAAKAGLHMLTRALAKDLAPDVRVNGVSPGAILWPEGDGDIRSRESIVAATPMKRTGDPEDIADTVLFLAKSGFITGQVINVDGGRSL